MDVNWETRRHFHVVRVWGTSPLWTKVWINAENPPKNYYSQSEERDLDCPTPHAKWMFAWNLLVEPSVHHFHVSAHFRVWLGFEVCFVTLNLSARRSCQPVEILQSLRIDFGVASTLRGENLRGAFRILQVLEELPGFRSCLALHLNDNPVSSTLGGCLCRIAPQSSFQKVGFALGVMSSLQFWIWFPALADFVTFV